MGLFALSLSLSFYFSLLMQSHVRLPPVTASLSLHTQSFLLRFCSAQHFSKYSFQCSGDTGNGNEKGAEASFVMSPFRPSFLRAALLQTSTRQEAQLQCLLTCVKAGSARNATKARTEALLQPALTLLEFAVSKKREKQSILLGDLKLGINHIDVDQLRRNAILQPRYPTVLHSLSAVTVEGAVKSKASNDLIGSPAMVLYKIRVSAIVEAIDKDDADNCFYREEWVILRPFRDFVTLHKYLKKSVNEKESSGNGQYSYHRWARRIKLVHSA